MRFYELEPWGSADEWNRAGTVAAAAANYSFGRGRGSKALSARDFTPKFGAPRDDRPQWERDRDQTLAALRARGITCQPPG